LARFGVAAGVEGAERWSALSKKRVMKRMMPQKGSRQLCKLLRDAVIDEKKASHVDYPRLLAKTKELRSKMPKELGAIRGEIEVIIEDERRHHGVIDGIYRYVCVR
jgi:hypothetical protein